MKTIFTMLIVSAVLGTVASCRPENDHEPLHSVSAKEIGQLQKNENSKGIDTVKYPPLKDYDPWRP